MPKGIFVALVGPSGVGKDTLLRQAARAFEHRPDFAIARRVITREPDGVTEDHDTLTREAFETERARGAFCLSWQAHGLAYGLPASVLGQVEDGAVIVANVSRGVLFEAASVFPCMSIVWVDADPAVLAKRIASRGRESAEQATLRANRRIPVMTPPGCSIYKIDNSGELGEAAKALISVLDRLMTPRL